MIFEMYLELASSWKANELWRKYSARTDEAGEMLMLTEDEVDELVECEKNRFHGFCLLLTSFVSNNRNQLFYHSLALKFHGLSRMGNHMLAQIGFALKPSTFDSLQQQMLEKSKQKIRY